MFDCLELLFIMCGPGCSSQLLSPLVLQCKWSPFPPLQLWIFNLFWCQHLIMLCQRTVAWIFPFLVGNCKVLDHGLDILAHTIMWYTNQSLTGFSRCPCISENIRRTFYLLEIVVVDLFYRPYKFGFSVGFRSFYRSCFLWAEAEESFDQACPV